jgi:SH3 domain-containing YSC84-like protein 1
MQKTPCVLLLILATAISSAAADDSTARLGKAAAVLDTMTQSGHDIRAGLLAGADCVAVIPGFKKGAAVVGVGYGSGFISCRNGSNWSAPGAIYTGDR